MKKGYRVELLFIAAFSCMINFSQPAFGAVLLDRVVATVNDEVITWSELMNVISLEGKEYLEGVPENVKKERIQELERPFLNNLINIKLQLQAARKMGLEVTAEEVEGAVNEIKSKFAMSEESFMNSLESEKLTLKEYKSRLSDQILLQKAVNVAVKNNIVISDKEIEEYFTANKNQYIEKEKLKIRQIFFSAPQDPSLKVEIETKAKDIVKRVRQGEDFSALAAEFSQDAGGQSGGDLGYISRGSVLKEIEEMAFSLRPGDISEPFWSKTGLHIIKVDERIEGGSFDKVKDKIKANLFQKAYESKYHEWTTGLREKAYVEIKL